MTHVLSSFYCKRNSTSCIFHKKTKTPKDSSHSIHNSLIFPSLKPSPQGTCAQSQKLDTSNFCSIKTLGCFSQQLWPWPAAGKRSEIGIIAEPKSPQKPSQKTRPHGFRVRRFCWNQNTEIRTSWEDLQGVSLVQRTVEMRDILTKHPMIPKAFWMPCLVNGVTNCVSCAPNMECTWNILWT